MILLDEYLRRAWQLRAGRASSRVASPTVLLDLAIEARLELPKIRKVNVIGVSWRRTSCYST